MPEPYSEWMPLPPKPPAEPSFKPEVLYVSYGKQPGAPPLYDDRDWLFKVALRFLRATSTW